jgi:peptidyl-prolyl cis-trans isomerase SurA
MRTGLLSLLTGAAIIAAPVSLCAAQTPPATPTASPAVTRSAADTSKNLQVDGIAATVGDKVILISEVEAFVNAMRSKGREPKSELEYAEMKRDALNELIDIELLVQKAVSEKVEVQDAVVQKQWEAQEQTIRKQFPNEAEFRKALREAGMGTVEEWRKAQIEAMRRTTMQQDVMQKLKRENKVPTVNVSEKEVSEAYQKAKSQLPKKPARIGFRQIIIPTTPSEASKKRARDKIDSIRAELVKHPDDFESVAKRESMDSVSAQLGGDIGWFRRGAGLAAEYERMIFALNPGVISPVVETSFGYHIIRVDRVQPAEVKSRHILIMPKVDSADEARTRAVAKEVAEAWRKGASVDSLTIRYHDEAGNEDKSIPEFPRDSLPEQYRNAIEGKKLNDVLDPFPIPSGRGNTSKFVVAQITFLDSAGEYTYEEYRSRIRQQLAEEASFRRLIDSLKKSTYVNVRYDPLAEVKK